jgi:hypothetical protein
LLVTGGGCALVALGVEFVAVLVVRGTQELEAEVVDDQVVR